tara:strand:- start:376 stop:1260 length:885 start_codon:yes stop_codon:yes gene_type:complete
MMLVVLGSACEHGSHVSLGEAGQKTSESLLKVAKDLSASGDLVTASRLYRQALTLDPDNDLATLEYAGLLRKMNQLDEALEVVKICGAKKPDCPKVKVETGSIYLAKHQPREARYFLETVLEKEPENLIILNAMGVSYDLEGRHKQAQLYYEKALRLESSYASAQANKALSLALQGEHAKAISLLEKRVERLDASLKDRENLALVYGLTGQYEKAANLYGEDLSRQDIQRNIAYLQTIRSNIVYDQPEEPETMTLESFLQGGQTFERVLGAPVGKESLSSQEAGARNQFLKKGL